MIDRLVHHAEVIPLKGDSYRLKDRDLGRTAAAAAPLGNNHQPPAGVNLHLPPGGSIFSRRRQFSTRYEDIAGVSVALISIGTGLDDERKSRIDLVKLVRRHLPKRRKHLEPATAMFSQLSDNAMAAAR